MINTSSVMSLEGLKTASKKILVFKKNRKENDDESDMEDEYAGEWMLKRNILLSPNNPSIPVMN